LLRKEKKKFHIQASNNISSPDFMDEELAELEEEEEEEEEEADSQEINTID